MSYSGDDGWEVECAGDSVWYTPRSSALAKICQNCVCFSVFGSKHALCFRVFVFWAAWRRCVFVFSCFGASPQNTWYEDRSFHRMHASHPNSGAKLRACHSTSRLAVTLELSSHIGQALLMAEYLPIETLFARPHITCTAVPLPMHCGREAGVWYFGEGASQLWRALGVGSGRPRPIPRKCARVAYLGWFWFGARRRCCVREACEGGCSCAEDPAIGVRDWCSPVYVYVATLSWSGDPLQSIAGGLSGGSLARMSISSSEQEARSELYASTLAGGVHYIGRDVGLFFTVFS